MARGRALDVEQELIEAFRQSGRVSEYLVEVLPASLWRTAPPGGRGRSLAAIVAHMQSVRRTFARMGVRIRAARARAPRLSIAIAQAPRQAQRALRQSTEDLARLFETAIAARRARVQGMPRRVVNMLMYLVQHDAHHRGQICGLARDLGHEFSSQDTMRIWGWKAMPPTR